MKRYTGVIGTMKTVPTLEVSATTVFIRSNIKEIDWRGRKAWQFDEIRYDLKEYQRDLGEKTNELEANSNVIAELVATTTEDAMTSTEMLTMIVEDTAATTELLTTLTEQNALLTKRIEALEKTKGVVNNG